MVCKEWMGYETSTPEYGAEVDVHSASSADAKKVWRATRRSGSSRWRCMVMVEFMAFIETVETGKGLLFLHDVD